MCRLLTDRHADDFRPVSRSIRIHGHSTSLRLEACFWRALDDIAREEGLTTPKLIETLHGEAANVLTTAGDAALNLASVLRTACLLLARIAPAGAFSDRASR